MTLRDFFVSAYYSDKGLENVQVKKIIQDAGLKYKSAIEEYNSMNDWIGSDGVLRYINDHIRYGKQKFFDKYKPSLMNLGISVD